MSDTYQAIYDAVRSRITGFDSNRLMQEIASRFDISHQIEILKQEFSLVAYAQAEPSVLLRPKIYIDGDKWCALYGENIQDGVCGFGDSPKEAFNDFNKNFETKLTP